MLFFGRKNKKKPVESKPSREKIIAQAMANARKARAEIGEETIQKIARDITEKMNKKKT